MRKFLKQLLPFLLNFLQSEAIKASLKLLFKSVIPSGFKLWLVKYVVKEILFDKAITPAVKRIFLEIGYSFDVLEGHILIKRLNNAENQQEYDNTIDDIIG